MNGGRDRGEDGGGGGEVCVKFGDQLSRLELGGQGRRRERRE